MKPKFKVGQKFVCINHWDSNYCLEDDFIEIIEIVEPNQTPKNDFITRFYPENLDNVSYIVHNKKFQMLRIVEAHLSEGYFFKKLPKEWEDHFISSSMVSTAIFEYLEKRGFKPDRKRGVRDAATIGGFRTGDYFVKVEKKCTK